MRYLRKRHCRARSGARGRTGAKVQKMQVLLGRDVVSLELVLGVAREALEGLADEQRIVAGINSLSLIQLSSQWQSPCTNGSLSCSSWERRSMRAKRRTGRSSFRASSTSRCTTKPISVVPQLRLLSCTETNGSSEPVTVGRGSGEEFWRCGRELLRLFFYVCFGG